MSLPAVPAKNSQRIFGSEAVLVFHFKVFGGNFTLFYEFGGRNIFCVSFFVQSSFLHKGKAVVLAGFVWSVFSDCAILYHSEILI